MNRILPRDIQLLNEQTYCRKHIDPKIRQEILDNQELCERMRSGIQMLEEWMDGEYYASKNARLQMLKNLDLEELVLSIMVGIAYCQTPELYTSVTAQLAGRLKFSDKADGITTIAEIVAILCHTDAFDIIKESAQASLKIQSRIPLSEALIHQAVKSAYLPPMVYEPEDITHNHESPYLTFNESLILGKGNHHDGDLCLDVLNSKNKVPLKLDIEFLCNVEEEPTSVIDTVEKQRNWQQMKAQSHEFYKLIVGQGNLFYMTYKPDKRGRLYSQGYHINPQGSPYKKAMIEFAEEEVVRGVPK